VPCPDVTHWGIVARQSGGKRVAACLLARLQPLQPREGLKENVVYVFTFQTFKMLEF
jgi:hypothetical protein